MSLKLFKAVDFSQMLFVLYKSLALSLGRQFSFSLTGEDASLKAVPAGTPVGIVEEQRTNGFSSE